MCVCVHRNRTRRHISINFVYADFHLVKNENLSLMPPTTHRDTTRGGKKLKSISLNRNSAFHKNVKINFYCASLLLRFSVVIVRSHEKVIRKSERNFDAVDNKLESEQKG